MAVFDDIQKDRPLFGIQRNEEEVIQDEQWTSLDFLEFRFYRSFGLGNLEGTQEFGRVGVYCPDASLARLISNSGGEVTFTGPT